MGCSSCSTGKNGSPGGCQNNGHCATGGCNKLNTYDWLSKINLPVYDDFDVIEVTFKNGARKGFYAKTPDLQVVTGEKVVVEAGTGYDIGRVSLSGELVRIQMKKKRVSRETVVFKVLRLANERDLERLMEARGKEQAVMVKSRVISRSLNLDMKVSDVEFQGDKRKATFYYTAEGRVDFRELIRHYAREFRVKIEMRQIGARQESARIGGLGSCGRELCCSTWLTDFKSVSTTAARYQNLAINQSKLSGQCGRLKCCLNYELDTYMDALKGFPKHADRLQTEAGLAVLLKTDIFKGIMYYSYRENMGKTYAIEVARVKEILQMNKKGEKPMELVDSRLFAADLVEEIGFEDGAGEIELPPEKRRSRRNRGRNRNRRGPRKDEASPQRQKNKTETKGTEEKRQDSSQSRNRRRRPSSKPSTGQNRNTQGGAKKQGDNRPKKESTERTPPKDGKANTRPKNTNERKPNTNEGKPSNRSNRGRGGRNRRNRGGSGKPNPNEKKE